MVKFYITCNMEHEPCSKMQMLDFPEGHLRPEKLPSYIDHSSVMSQMVL